MLGFANHIEFVLVLFISESNCNLQMEFSDAFLSPHAVHINIVVAS